MSQSWDSSLTPQRLRSYDSKNEGELLSLDGEALDSDYPSLEDSPKVLARTPPQPIPKHKLKLKSGRQVKRKSQPSKKDNPSEFSLRSKSRKGLSSFSLLSAPSIPDPPLPIPLSTKQGQRVRKERDKGGKKERLRSGKSPKLSGSSRKGKLQSKVSVLVREGVSSTTGVVRVGKQGVVGRSSKDLSAQTGGSGGGVVGGSIAVVFRRDNESRSPFLKPCSEPISILGKSKGLGKMRRRGNIAPLSSTTTSSCQLSVLKPKKARSTTSASSSSASSPSSSSTTTQRRKQGKKGKDYWEKGRSGAMEEGEDSNCGLGGGSWGGSGFDIQLGSVVSAKPSSPPPGFPTSTPSSSSTSVAPPSSPPHTPLFSLPPSHDTRESTPDSQTVDSSCKTPDASFLSEDSMSQAQNTPLVPTSNVPSSSPLLQAPLGGAMGISQSIPDPRITLDEQKAHSSPPCFSSSSSCSIPASLSLSLPPTATDRSSSSVSSSSTNKPPPPPAVPPLPWSLQTGVDCTAGGVLALTALLFKMEEANLASRAKAHEFIQATSQILSQVNQSQTQQHPPTSSSLSTSSSQVLPLPSLAPTPTQFIFHSSLPLVGSTKTSLSLGGGCTQTLPTPMLKGPSGGTGGLSETGWDNESKDPEKYLKKLHTQERAVEEVKLAIKPYYQRKDINKDEYKDILRKAVHKICHSRTGEINPVKVSNLVKLYVQRYKYFRKHGRRMDDDDEEEREGEPTMFHYSS
ncbi:hypothetical protein AAFF_G00366390 [Aldrovandia affinis]|uniref:SFR19-like C-terminal domain-containing protein n=1 Tax=Aldrovandia affinis TaxID=143900 RepID=A0AAD7SH96_9TELE|nr:hypothetical protein AAFF_G00366390 [Aldrovandia affinis]